MNCIYMAATVATVARRSRGRGERSRSACWRRGRPPHAETGYDAWLRYAPITDRAARDRYADLPAVVVALGDSPIVAAAQAELTRGVRDMLGRTLRSAKELPAEGAIVLGTYDSVTGVLKSLGKLPELPPDGFWLKSITVDGKSHLVITAPSERGVLYGAFTLLRMIGLEASIADLNVRDKPYAPIRILNHWDNLDGTIERGYAGRSIFWDKGHVTKDLSRVRDYARLLASVGINGCSINNVNADVRVISADLLPEVARIADAFRPWGVKLYLSLDFASPRKIGGIDTFDPLDPAAVAFWKRKIDEVYKAIPDLGGFVLKADSEGRLGPSEYGRTHADAANVIAQALEPHGGILFYRGFVYDHKMDWNEPQERSRPRRLRQLPPARRQVRRQRRHPNQARPDRLPGPRARLAAVRRARENQPGNRAANHAGIPRPAATSLLPRADVEGRARLRHAGQPRGQGRRNVRP